MQCGGREEGLVFYPINRSDLSMIYHIWSDTLIFWNDYSQWVSDSVTVSSWCIFEVCKLVLDKLETSLFQYWPGLLCQSMRTPTDPAGTPGPDWIYRGPGPNPGTPWDVITGRSKPLIWTQLLSALCIASSAISLQRRDDDIGKTHGNDNLSKTYQPSLKS